MAGKGGHHKYVLLCVAPASLATPSYHNLPALRAMPLTNQEKRAARARENYGPNALGNLVRKKAYRNCDYTDEGQLRQFSDEASLLKFEEDKYSRGGRREPYSTQAKETVPQEQLALEYVAAMEAMSTVAQMEGHQTRVHQEYVAESLQHRHDEHDEGATFRVTD